MMWRSCLLLSLLPFTIPALAGPLQRIDAKFSHLRNTETQEWSRFSPTPDSDRLRVEFDLATPESFRLLTLRQEETKQPWEVQLNGQKLTTLPRDHNHLEHGVAIPAGILKATGNVLEIATGSTEADDIRVGDLALHDVIQVLVDGEREEILFQQRGFRRALPPMSATVTLKAVDAETGGAMPCRFTILDAGTGALVFVGAESDDRLAVREGIVYSLDGEATIRLAGDAEHPRRYQIYCGRGFEYSLSQGEIVIDGDEAKGSLDFTLRREVPTPGLVASDPHLHTFQFDRHGDCNLAERLISIAGEGIELPVSTAHDQHIDYREEASRIGADRWFTPVLGCEVTTHLGHFGAFPVEPGATPAAHKMRPWPDIFQNIYGTPGVRVCILNHGRDLHSKYRPFDPENFDLATGTFRHGWKLEANAMELINSGAQRTDPMQLVQDWFALLKSGHKIAGIGASDSHTVNFAIPGQSRTYLEAVDQNPGAIVVGEAIDSLVAGRSWVCFGLLARLDLDAEKKTVTARVLGPGWTTADRFRIFRDGEEIFSMGIPEAAGKSAGEKFAKEFSLSELLPTSEGFLCAVATGPGITGGWWSIMPPYQPDSPDFEPFVMGISPAVRVK
ncbi:MAG: hypothetical protein KA250_00235 [Verrucomicrobiales bacterium]|jgi:hypothetical protein|nr:hypothetical protein [Verrucomicrobiales bacterium]MBP9224720.1 hypothetical protein [Verrucomicrobiales bacterium]